MPSMTLICFICNLPMEKRSYSAPQGEAAHNACRKSVNAHGVSGYRRGCRCEACREGQNKAMRDYNRKRKDRDGVGPTTQWKRRQRGVDPLAVVACVRCGDPVKNVRPGSGRPIHKACRAGAEWMRHSEIGPKQRAMLAKLDKAARGTTGGKRVFTCGGCDWCGEYFVGVGKYCSGKCKNEAAYLRRGSGISFKISKRARLEIYERDGWTCQLCMRPVDRSADWRTSWYPTLDHIIPQSTMLVPDHSPSNLRLAHMWCNAARGDGSNMTEAEFHLRIADLFEEVAV